MKYIFCLAVFYSCMQCACMAQSIKVDRPSYKTAIGVRFSPFGVSFKANTRAAHNSFELIGYFHDGFVASALYYWNFKVNEPGNIKLYLGGGGLAGFKNEVAGGSAELGVGGILGADYKFLHLPINISLDWQPAYQIGRDNEFKSRGGIAARFTL